MNAKGFTLIELMITLTIGLIILGGASVMYYGIHRSYLMQTALSRVEDEGRFALQYMSDIIRMAGYRYMMAPNPLGLAIDGHSITVAMDSLFTCDGKKNKQNEYLPLTYTFSIDTDRKSLQRTCNDDNQPIAGKKDSLYGAQIEDLQFRVGIDQDGDASVDRYDTADSIGWSKPEEALTVRSVQICLEISSSDPVFHDMGKHFTKPYTTCANWAEGKSNTTLPDDCINRYCQVFHTTVFLRNRGLP